jgi:hypothetical protein
MWSPLLRFSLQNFVSYLIFQLYATCPHHLIVPGFVTVITYLVESNNYCQVPYYEIFIRLYEGI